MEELAKGDRVVVQLPNRPSFKGVIVGEGREGKWWHIIKDGTKRPQAFIKSVCRRDRIQPNTSDTE